MKGNEKGNYSYIALTVGSVTRVGGLDGLVTQVVSDPCSPMDCSPAGSSAYGISQARVLEWVAISFCRGSS